MMRRDLGGGDQKEEGEESYLARPDAADCEHYLRTGFCGFGSRCPYNHHRDRSTVIGAVRAGGEELPERAGQPVCQYYMRTGTCKYGASCKYHHPRQGCRAVTPMPLNIFGYPLRLGEKECSYYMKTGLCKFGPTCKFHHPLPDSMVQAPTAGPLPVPAPMPASLVYPSKQSPPAPSPEQYAQVARNWAVGRPPLVPGSYLQGPSSSLLLAQGTVPHTGWDPYQRISIEEIKSHPWFLKKLPSELAEAAQAICYEREIPNLSFQSEEEIMKIVEEAKTSPPASCSIGAFGCGGEEEDLFEMKPSLMEKKLEKVKEKCLDPFQMEPLVEEELSEMEMKMKDLKAEVKGLKRRMDFLNLILSYPWKAEEDQEFDFKSLSEDFSRINQLF